MKNLIYCILFLVSIKSSTSFMNYKDFQAKLLKQCYSATFDNQRQSIINGQVLPLPSSIETFTSLIERIETNNPNLRPVDIIKKLFMNFRIDDLPSGLNTVWTLSTKDLTELERVLFNIPKSSNSNSFDDDAFSSDEECALHFMLSHSCNESLSGNGNEETIEDGIVKHPREYGVVSLNAQWNHAFALGKVLLGIMSGLSGANLLDAPDVYGKWKNGDQDNNLNGVKINRLYAVTFGEMLSVSVSSKFKRTNIVIQPNGIWNDASCTTEYKLEENTRQPLTASLIRGAIDGLIIGYALEKNPETSSKLRLSQILRMYYGSEGITDNGRKSSIQWCNRRQNLDTLSSELRDEVVNFNKLYSSALGSNPSEFAQDDITALIEFIKSNPAIIDDVYDSANCNIGPDSSSSDRKCSTPFSLFSIIDINAPVAQKSFQIEVIGNLSVNFDVRPQGNTVGAYSNIRPVLGRGLDVIANNSGISGCPSCFVRYYERRGTKLDDSDLMERLNQTLTDYEEELSETRNKLDESNTGVSSKVVLLFNYQTQVNNDYRLREAVWEIQKSFREVTILAVGSRRDNLEVFTTNDDTDIFTESANAALFANKLKTRICKVPAEFEFKECNQNVRSAKVNSFVSVGKLQYWAMYPKYFLKSFHIYMKFVPLEGAQIRVCFARDYSYIIESQYVDCKESSSEEIKFYVKNPCYRYNEHNCPPFYFSVEGKKTSNTLCENSKCRTANDILFEFQHEGISCNSASVFSISVLLLLISLHLSFSFK